MHRVDCESCKATYQVDERRIPLTGLKMRCPKCGHTFLVKIEGGVAVVKAIQAGGVGGAAPPPSSKPDPAKPASAPKSPAALPDDPFADLPSPVKAGMPPAPKPAAKPALPATQQERRPQLGSALGPKPPTPGGPAAPPRPGLRSLDDLPAVVPAGRPKLPPTVPQRDPRGPIGKPPPPAPSLELEMDLPAKPKPDLPALAARLAKSSASTTSPSAPKSQPGRALPLRGAAKSAPELDSAFGEVDLPAIGGADLPAVAADLPELAAALPELAASLPQVAASLPANLDSLPTAASALPANLDSLPMHADSLPVHTDSLPSHSSAPPADIIAQDDLGDFGELDLPPGPLSNRPGGRASAVPGRISSLPNPATSKKPPADDMGVGRAADFGDLFNSPQPPAAAPMNDPFGDAIAHVRRESIPDEKERAPAGGGMSFGEVNLGGDDSASAEIISTVAQEASVPLGPSVGASLPAGAPTEVSLGTAPTRPRARGTDEEKKSGKRWVLPVIVLLALGGAALEATPYGAFGRYPISDLIHADDYQRAAMSAGASARTKMLSDIFPDSRSAVDAVEAAHRASPRARPLTAYFAVAELSHELRFGEDADVSARARVALGEIPPNVDVKYAPVAIALQSALGDITKGRAALDAASKRDGGDPIQEDIAYARGALELRARDGKAAATAFEKAMSMRPSDAAKNARGHYGLARAHTLDNDIPGARKELDLTLAASPKHAGARFLKAKIAWENDRDDTGALEGLASILEGAFKESASPSEQASAFALRGDIQEARGRPAEARAAYDAALKVEAHNVDALIGQGEVLFSEGRFTEAVSRFDTAVQSDPLSVRAILSDAKGKIALEHLADAKTQLTAARAAFPKDPRVAVQLGKANEALGDKPAAEHEYLAAIDLVDVTKTEAIEPYVALAGLLAGEGRTKDAEAKLEEARTRLPDSAQMQRALGEVAAAQGNYNDAVTHYLSAITKNPNDISTKFLLGVTYRRMSKMDLASAEFDEVVASDKDYPGLALERGLLYEASGDVDKALEQFQAALAKAPDDPDLQLRVGAAYVAIGRTAEAVPVLQKVLKARPDSAEANHYLGRAIFLQSGATQGDAMRYLKRAVELDPNRAEYHLFVAWAANNAVPAQLGLAKDEIDKALGLDKLLGDGYWQRGVLEQKEGSIDDAIRDLKRALELKPTRTDAHAALAICYDNKNDQATEIAEWQKAIAGNDHMPEWRLRFGKLLLERGSSAEAAKHLSFAAVEGEKLDPRPGWLPEADFYAGEALRKTGAREQAIERYKKFLDIAPTNSPDRRDAIQALAGLGVSTP